MINREKVYKDIDTERNYQEGKWPGHVHSITEFLVYIQDYTNEALHMLSRNDDRKIAEKASHIVRKITALGVACMEQNGSYPRSKEEIRNVLMRRG